MKVNGYEIVLTSDRTLFSDYGGGIFLGFVSCFPKSLIPEWIFFNVFCPPTKVGVDGLPLSAPLGLRVIESLLLNSGFKRDQVAVVHPDHLDKAVGPDTKILGLSEMDPLGVGPATSTFTQIFRGPAYMPIKLKALLNNPVVTRYKPKVVLGGSGAWQLENDEATDKLGIDCVVLGEGESVVPNLFHNILQGEPIPKVIYGQPIDAAMIPSILGPSMNGLVEISRGCGRGCFHCSLASSKKRDMPLEHILKDVVTTLRYGRSTPILHAEDVLLYGSNGSAVDKESVMKLFKEVKKLPEVKFIDISHFSISSVLQAPDLIGEISQLLGLGGEQKFLGAQVGVETGSQRLIKKCMKGKPAFEKSKGWYEDVIVAFETLMKNNWVPAATLLIGLPDETYGDLEESIQLVEDLKTFKSLLVPLFFVSHSREKSFNIENLNDLHRELIIKSWEHNFRWMSLLYKEYSSMYMHREKWPIYLLLTLSAKYMGRRLKRLLSP
ncbi:MAG: radical SAM protein [Methanocellales archaeon]|nr:radical SAM protein [Methanocellales archaeon]MDD3421437.1 radical SAM protein [Methanocellales archaeon]MDD5446648.1 radical SAM protein [Methanocellales archaeon]